VNLRMQHEQLVRKIQQFGAEAREGRQVYRRLMQLLPDRLKMVSQGFRQKGLGPAHSARSAFSSDEFVQHIHDVVDVSAASLEARIQFETHMMLVDARRSLRSYNRISKS
jgi:hypothetical protein